MRKYRHGLTDGLQLASSFVKGKIVMGMPGWFWRGFLEALFEAILVTVKLKEPTVRFDRWWKVALFAGRIIGFCQARRHNPKCFNKYR